eukprot:m51a1_g6964 hypothetical protein (299) ;mRNA; r:86090-87207
MVSGMQLVTAAAAASLALAVALLLRGGAPRGDGTRGAGAEAAQPPRVLMAPTGITGIDAVYVFNLEAQAGRREQVLRLLGELGIRNARVVRAYEAERLKEQYERGNYTVDAPWATRLDLRAQGDQNARNARDGSDPGVIWKQTSQYYTFLKAYREFHRSGFRTALFFEDDVDLVRDFVPRAERIVRDAPQPWNVLWLGGCTDHAGSEVAVAPDIRVANVHWCCDAYVLHREGLGAVLDCLDREWVEVANPDYRYNHVCAKQPGWRSYAAWPKIATQTRFRQAGFNSARMIFGIDDPKE